MDLNIENSINHISNNSFSDELKNTLNKDCIFSIDRFEDNFAVCENKITNEMVNIEKTLLPKNCKEGDIIKFENGVYILDNKTTNNEQEEIKDIVNNLFKKNK